MSEARGPKRSRGASYVALLRGINVGGRNKLEMQELAALFVEAGCVDVRTYIQSGNVVFRSTSATAGRLAGEIARRIADRHGLEVPLVLRTAAELRATIHGTGPLLPPATGWPRSGAASDTREGCDRLRCATRPRVVGLGVALRFASRCGHVAGGCHDR